MNDNSIDGSQSLLSDDRTAEIVEIGLSTKCDNNCECSKKKIYFRDGFRSVDFILVWSSLTDAAITDEAIKKRKIFERNLIKEGLELEHEPAESNGLNFIKVKFKYL